MAPTSSTSGLQRCCTALHYTAAPAPACHQYHRYRTQPSSVPAQPQQQAAPAMGAAFSLGASLLPLFGSSVSQRRVLMVGLDNAGKTT